MKRILFTIVMMLCVNVMFAQKDVTTFLGIPVDGTKAAMRQKLVAKGFKYDQKSDALTGVFNGAKVRISIITNNNKVCRIAVYDETPVDETQIRIRFNNLVRQFQNNSNKYTWFNDYTISESEDVSYEMSVHKKRYEAAFYQLPDMAKVDTLAFKNIIIQEMLKKYTEEQLLNPTEDMEKEYNNISTNKAIEFMQKKSVWFMIGEFYGQYFIAMYYDNEYNRANGEDL